MFKKIATLAMIATLGCGTVASTVAYAQPGGPGYDRRYDDRRYDDRRYDDRRDRRGDPRDWRDDRWDSRWDRGRDRYWRGDERGWRMHVRRCFRNYRSYDPHSDTYIGYDGRPHRCRL